MRCRMVLVAVAIIAARQALVAEPVADGRPLAAREAEVLQRYRDLEAAFLRLADALDATDPARAKALRAAFERGREVHVGDRVAEIVDQLERGQLLKAGTGQLDAIERFREVLHLLESGGGNERLGDAKKKLRDLIGRVGKVAVRQRDVEAATETGDDAGRLAERQGQLAAEARRLADEAESRAGGSPASGKTPEGRESDAGNPTAGDQGDADDARALRTADRLRDAEERMRAARDKLDKDLRQDARHDQGRAIEELEAARAQLEEILRQVREQEVERTLVQLEARIRGMLKAERAVLADVERLAAVDAPVSPRERQLGAARLGREQDRIGVEAAKAVALVRDDGSAVAIPQAIEQVRDDATQAAERLAGNDLGRETLAVIGDIVTGLEEMLAAVEKAHLDRDARTTAPAGGGGVAGEQPLVDALAELKMLRTLQRRVNVRTQRLSRVLDDAPAEAAEVRVVLRRLAERQLAIEQAARAIVTGLDD